MLELLLESVAAILWTQLFSFKLILNWIVFIQLYWFLWIRILSLEEWGMHRTKPIQQDKFKKTVNYLERPSGDSHLTWPLENSRVQKWRPRLTIGFLEWEAEELSLYKSTGLHRSHWIDQYSRRVNSANFKTSSVSLSLFASEKHYFLVFRLIYGRIVLSLITNTQF